jgi:hypothetical protein
VFSQVERNFIFESLKTLLSDSTLRSFTSFDSISRPSSARACSMSLPSRPEKALFSKNSLLNSLLPGNLALRPGQLAGFSLFSVGVFTGRGKPTGMLGHPILVLKTGVKSAAYKQIPYSQEQGIF